MDVGTRIKEERERKGWTQEELASRCGYGHKSSISKVEAAGDKVSSKKVKRIAEALGVSVGKLMGWDETYSKAKQLFIENYEALVQSKDSYFSSEEEELFEELHSRTEMRMLFSTVRGLTKEQIEAIATMAKSFKGDDSDEPC